MANDLIQHPGPRRAREWIDVSAYAGGKVFTGLAPIALGGVGFLEAFAPGILSTVHMPVAMGTSLFVGAVGYMLPGLLKDKQAAPVKPAPALTHHPEASA